MEVAGGARPGRGFAGQAGVRVSNVTIDDLGIDRSRHLSVRVGVKADAAHVGGLDLFGRRFGNYPQDIVLRLRYHRPQEGGGGNGG